MISAISSSIAGLTAASNQMNTAATNVATSGPSPDDAVAMSTAKTGFDANIAMLKMEKSMDDQLVHMIDKLV